MLTIDLICVGKLKEKYLISAVNEYVKRLSGYCKLNITEIPEAQLPREPSDAEIDAALKAEFKRMDIPGRAAVFSLCIEGKQYSSAEFASLLSSTAVSGISRAVFIIGGSHGLHEDVKKLSAHRLSMSKMTFPHHMARVMLLEQLYRAFSILEGGKYHK